MRKVWLTLRTCVFYIGYTLLTTWFSLTGVIFLAFAPYAWRWRYLSWWNRLTLTWLALICGVRYRVIGADNIPVEPCIFLSKHQSQWETYYLQIIKLPIVPVLKRELLNIPGFGWGLRLLRAIAIDRGSPKQALRQINQQGQERLREGISIYIFPEGTRIPYGQTGKYARGGAGLAIATGAQVVPVAHNAGKFWPARRFLKYPGTITVVIGTPINPEGRDSRDITEQVQTWIEDQLVRIERGEHD